ncbi:hypothetical protein CONCODRAFT_14105 [Conidiobolus coronatus NRRL 28638]|uniref:Uncharacterized protein n=1 Tax=Conidiobolus coronatus (strain ATCC 28846 / CBS 209.66 / NRRL 28638) TaxID=796925 RepID=A0A137NPN0_CONC2|nr:hypothetical protein CONCODRAFT_14105 [Conidiobolus coronatus NRRL 28638]|eukprot:KXN64697.1 hypothetical protein CONCODRAFT_14105 [Conidiobolus coronatus NRRL 28638]
MPSLSCNIAVANSPCTFSNDKQTDNDEPGTNQISSSIACAPVLQFIKLQSSSVLLNPYPIIQKQSTE